MSKKDRAKKRERVSAKQRATSHNVSRDFAALTIPKDLNKISIKEDCQKRWSIVPYIATEKNPLAVKYGGVGEYYPERTYWIHGSVGPDNQAYACPARNTAHLSPKKRLKCPICEYRAKAAKAADADEDLIKSLLPKERQLWLVYDHDVPEKGVQLFEASFHGLGKDLDEAIRNADEDDGYEFFADPEDGFILRIGFKEKPTGGNGKWFPPARIDFKPRSKPLPEEIIDHGIEVDDIVKILPYEELESIFLQEMPEDDDKPKKRKDDDDDDEDDDDDDDEPIRPSKKKKRVVEEEDDDDDDDDDEPVKPAKKKRKPVEDDDDDDDDDDEPPRKKSKSRR